MIAWGPGPFENEEGTDWTDDLIESRDLASIVLAMQSVVEFAGTDELETQDCAIALVACECVAAANSQPHKDIAKRLSDFLAEMNIGVDENALGLARKAVEKVKQTPAMLRHFKDAGTLDEWLDSLENLESRLT